MIDWSEPISLIILTLTIATVAGGILDATQTIRRIRRQKKRALANQNRGGS